MKAFLRFWLTRLLRWLSLPSAQSRLYEAQAQNRALLTVLEALPREEQRHFGLFSEIASEMIESRLMAGAGPAHGNPNPQLIHEAREAIIRVQERALGLRENIPTGSGAFGDIELALQKVEGRGE